MLASIEGEKRFVIKSSTLDGNACPSIIAEESSSPLPPNDFLAFDVIRNQVDARSCPSFYPLLLLPPTPANEVLNLGKDWNETGSPLLFLRSPLCDRGMPWRVRVPANCGGMISLVPSERANSIFRLWSGFRRVLSARVSISSPPPLLFPLVFSILSFLFPFSSFLEFAKGKSSIVF